MCYGPHATQFTYSLTHLLTYSHYLLTHLLSLLTHLVEAGASERRPRDKEITWPVVARLDVAHGTLQCAAEEGVAWRCGHEGDLHLVRVGVEVRVGVGVGVGVSVRVSAVMKEICTEVWLHAPHLSRHVSLAPPPRHNSGHQSRASTSVSHGRSSACSRTRGTSSASR